eukprot:CAMPEP_0170529676 /NCGR_PEP_ID=MMETSP0209-20121228/27796_1 /TAXON_ID=665100 ORGANISM="Litonotus pictus, Strain P1" /NCGR_SAMPLE_ID=MMETSP0209 /ASSEMBLY_ACC=CAM_ASM_000301 /LENGTH=105 /DNA_ID=CAMNT_0010821923 /DNA_START=48 /DNA_END=365 /DNA_ORIENTATION=+
MEVHALKKRENKMMSKEESKEKNKEESKEEEKTTDFDKDSTLYKSLESEHFEKMPPKDGIVLYKPKSKAAIIKGKPLTEDQKDRFVKNRIKAIMEEKKSKRLEPY